MDLTSTVRVWFIATDAPAPLPALAEVLDDDQRCRVAGLLHPADRRRFTIAHAATRLILADLLGVGSGDIRWRHGPHGKPELTAAGDRSGLRVNLSHSGELAAVAVTHGPQLGVDVQQLSPRLDAARMSSRFYPEAEARFVTAPDDPARRLARFVRLWTRKEACVKASGARLTQGLSLPVRGGGRTGGAARSPAGIVVRQPGGALPGPYLVRDVPAPAGFRAAVAVEGDEPFAVSRRWWRADGGHAPV